jgi:hypothetical protein
VVGAAWEGEEVMQRECIGIFAALVVFSPVAHAGSAPRELYGKSFTVSWSETLTQRFESDQRVRPTGRSVQMNIYVSSGGRPFVRVISSGIGGHSRHELGGRSASPTSLAETAPTEAAKDRVVFEGRSIVVYRQFRSGARRIAIESDGTSCKAAVLHGREGGKSIAQYSTGFGAAEILSVEVSAVSCSVREGNVFGQ